MKIFRGGSAGGPVGRKNQQKAEGRIKEIGQYN